MARHQDDELQDVPPGKAGSAVLYVVCAIVFVASFWLFGYAFEIGSPLLFAAALAIASGAFFVPMQLLARPR